MCYCENRESGDDSFDSIDVFVLSIRVVVVVVMCYFFFRFSNILNYDCCMIHKYGIMILLHEK